MELHSLKGHRPKTLVEKWSPDKYGLGVTYPLMRRHETLKPLHCFYVD